MKNTSRLDETRKFSESFVVLIIRLVEFNWKPLICKQINKNSSSYDINTVAEVAPVIKSWNNESNPSKYPKILISTRYIILGYYIQTYVLLIFIQICCRIYLCRWI